METPNVGTTHDGEDILCGCLTGVDDVSDLDMIMVFDEAHRILKQVNFIPCYYVCFYFLLANSFTFSIGCSTLSGSVLQVPDRAEPV